MVFFTNKKQTGINVMRIFDHRLRPCWCSSPTRNPSIGINEMRILGQHPGLKPEMQRHLYFLVLLSFLSSCVERKQQNFVFIFADDVAGPTWDIQEAPCTKRLILMRCVNSAFNSLRRMPQVGYVHLPRHPTLPENIRPASE